MILLAEDITESTRVRRNKSLIEIQKSGSYNLRITIYKPTG
jgi:hypothetical protein